MAQSDITVTMGAASSYAGSQRDLSNSDEIYELRTRTYTVDVDGTAPTVTKRDGGLYVVEGVAVGSPVVITLPDPGVGYEVRYIESNKNPTHTSALYTGPLTYTTNKNSSDNTILKFRVYNTANHTIRGDVVRIEFNVAIT